MAITSSMPKNNGSRHGFILLPTSPEKQSPQTIYRRRLLCLDTLPGSESLACPLHPYSIWDASLDTLPSIPGSWVPGICPIPLCTPQFTPKHVGKSVRIIGAPLNEPSKYHADLNFEGQTFLAGALHVEHSS